MATHALATHALPTQALSTRPVAAPVPAVPWRDPHTVSPEELSEHIARLEQMCLDHPQSADVRTCLGMAYAMNFEVYKSMDALEIATALDPSHFWAQMKLAELQYRLRALNRAEKETATALNLAGNAWQFATARKQLQDIRRLKHESIRNVEWTKGLTLPAAVFSIMMVALFVAMAWR